MTELITGGCLCSAVVTNAGAAAVRRHCRCRDCRKDTGTGHSSHLGVPADALSISGALRQYDTTAESGNVPTGDYVRSAARRSLFETSGVAGLTFLTAGSIDYPTLFEPGMVVFTASARLWDHIDPALQRFPRMPQA